MERRHMTWAGLCLTIGLVVMSRTPVMAEELISPVPGADSLTTIRRIPPTDDWRFKIHVGSPPPGQNYCGGDLNLNGYPFEIPDAVSYEHYLLYGLSSLGDSTRQQVMVQSDINCDWLRMTVEDFVLMIKVIVGDALPYPQPHDLHALVTSQDGTLSITDASLGAALMVLKGEVTPSLLCNNAVMSYTFDGTNTRVLVHAPFDINQIGMPIEGFEGEIIGGLGADAKVLNIWLADIHGFPLKIAKPITYELLQNYPNPFNMSTTLVFTSGTYQPFKLTIYNALGEIVQVVAGSGFPGVRTIKWQPADLASGVYYYKLEIDDYSEVRKAVLLK